jgi:hypothetical protein
MDTATIAIICIIVAIIICIIALLIFFICWCRLKIVDDTNIRKRVLVRNVEGYAQEEVKTQIVEQPIVVPAPVPVPVPLPRREVIQEYIPPPPRPSTPQPDIVVHEVVHRYEPTPAPPPVVLPALPAPEPQRLVRRNSWTEGHHHHHHCNNNDEWIMIKKKKKGRKVREVDSDSSDDDDDYHRHRPRVNIVSPRLNAYDLAVPMPMAMAPMQPAMMPMASGAGMGAATYMVGRPVAAVPMVATTSTFQPTYGVLPRM